MILKSLSTALMMLIMVSPLYAGGVAPADETTAGAQPEPPASPIEARVRAYRESFERRQASQPAVDETLSKRQQEAQAQMEARRQAYIKQRQEREALAAKWREARQKYREARMEAWLKQAEDRQLREISRYEAMRNQAEEKYNYLVQNQEKLMEENLQRELEAASRHEEMRKQAEERRKQLVTLRATMKDMTPEERRAEIEKHRAELFGVREGHRCHESPPDAPCRMRSPHPQHATPPAAE